MKKVTIVLALAVATSSCSIFKKSEKKEASTTVKDKTEAVDKTAPAKKETAMKGVQKKAGGEYIKMEAGTDYKLIVDAPGDVYPDYGDHVELHLNMTVDDSMIFDTRTAMNGEPAPVPLQKSPFRGDLLEALKFMTAGDSAQVRLSVDSLVAAGAPEAPWMKKGTDQKVVYNVKIVSVTPKALKEKKEQADAAKQIEIDDKLIQEHLAKNKIKAEKTGSGLYYTISKQGTGAQATAGKKVSVNYTGMLLNGEKFDSNVDPQFQHVEPFQFVLGTGSVIKGWDEGIALLKEGGKGTLFIPSHLAYGKNSPSPKIPANGILVFDVELVDIVE
ncbi:MAG: FKBP-type peptidyl-prolyl cis-trans isomerase [Taibaiella sp.]|nr:FKBP-type peptidyl-prolyl cis-trans isomerase [Taibaiella sp.]